MTDVSLRYLLFGVDKDASKTITGVGAHAHSTAGVIGGAFSKMGSTIGGELGDLLDKVGAGLEGIGEHGMSMSQKLQGGGAALTGLGAALQLVGSKDKQATDQLKAAVDAAGGSWDTYREEVEKTIHEQENLGHGAVDTQNALQALVQATGSTEKATSSMGVVANLAAAKHISLAEAANLVAKIYAGSGSRTLKQYGVEMATTGDKTKNAEAALTALNGKLAGQAKAAVDNFGGRVDVIKTKIGDWVAVMSQKAGPVLTALGPVLMITGTIMQIVAARNAAAAAAQNAEAGATVRQTVAQRIAAVASKGWAAAQWLLNAALTANPIGLVIIAVAALIAIFIIAWKHSETFRNIVRAALRDVLGVFQAVWGWLKSNWPLLLAVLLGPIALAATLIFKHWDQVVGFFKAVPGRLAAIGHGMWDFIKEAFRSAIDWIISAWNSLEFKIPGFHAGPVHFGGFTLGVPDIPMLAHGGVVTRPTMLIAGEAGPEAIIPLGRAMPSASQPVQVNVTFSGVVGDPVAAGRQIVDVLQKTFAATGLKPA